MNSLQRRASTNPKRGKKKTIRSVKKARKAVDAVQSRFWFLAPDEPSQPKRPKVGPCLTSGCRRLAAPNSSWCDKHRAQPEPSDEFWAFIRDVDRLVAKWPEWKRLLIGKWPS